MRSHTGRDQLLVVCVAHVHQEGGGVGLDPVLEPLDAFAELFVFGLVASGCPAGGVDHHFLHGDMQHQ